MTSSEPTRPPYSSPQLAYLNSLISVELFRNPFALAPGPANCRLLAPHQRRQIRGHDAIEQRQPRLRALSRLRFRSTPSHVTTARWTLIARLTPLGLPEKRLHNVGGDYLEVTIRAPIELEERGTLLGAHDQHFMGDTEDRSAIQADDGQLCALRPAGSRTNVACARNNARGIALCRDCRIDCAVRVE
jgi:hypothetical protein